MPISFQPRPGTPAFGRYLENYVANGGNTLYKMAKLSSSSAWETLLNLASAISGDQGDPSTGTVVRQSHAAALSASSSSAGVFCYTIGPRQGKAYAALRRAVRQALRLARDGAYIYRPLVDIVSQKQFVWGDGTADAPGTCGWFFISGLFPNELRNLWNRRDKDTPGSASTYPVVNTMTMNVRACSVNLFMRNCVPFREEVDVWVMYPRDDIPAYEEQDLTLPVYPRDFNDLVSESHIGNPIGAVWNHLPLVNLTGPDTFVQGIAARSIPSNINTNTQVEDVPLEARQYWASPFDSLFLTKQFRIQHAVNQHLMPGQEIRLNFGQGREWEFSPADHGQIWDSSGLSVSNTLVDESIDALLQQYAWMKAWGPVYAIRLRGAPAHSEIVNPPDPPNTLPSIGLHNATTTTQYGLDCVMQREMRVTYGTVQFDNNMQAGVLREVGTLATQMDNSTGGFGTTMANQGVWQLSLTHDEAPQ